MKLHDLELCSSLSIGTATRNGLLKFQSMSISLFQFDCSKTTQKWNTCFILFAGQLLGSEWRKNSWNLIVILFLTFEQWNHTCRGALDLSDNITFENFVKSHSGVQCSLFADASFAPFMSHTIQTPQHHSCQSPLQLLTFIKLWLRLGSDIEVIMWLYWMTFTELVEHQGPMLLLCFCWQAWSLNRSLVVAGSFVQQIMRLLFMYFWALWMMHS